MRGGHPRLLTLMTLVGIVVGVATFGVGRAHAQNSDAEALFSEGERLEAEGKVAEACDSFEASNRIEPRAGTLIRLGECRELEGRLTSAWSAYKDSLTRVKDPKKREIAEQRIAALQPRLSYLTVSVPDESRVDGLKVTRNGKDLDPALWNRAAPVDGGTYVIAGTAPGVEEWRTTVTVANEGDKVSVDIPRFKVLRELVDQPPPGGGAAGGGETPRASGPGMFTPKRKLAAGLAGVGAAAIIGGVMFGLQAKGLEDDAFTLCPDPAVGCDDAAAAQDALDRAGSKALLSNVAFGVGVASLAGATVLWLTGGPKAGEAATTVSARVRPGLLGFDYTVRF